MAGDSPGVTAEWLTRFSGTIVADREMLYLMTFCLPRFLNRPFEDKFVTLFHEPLSHRPRL